jgi:hypothetical protein
MRAEPASADTVVFFGVVDLAQSSPLSLTYVAMAVSGEHHDNLRLRSAADQRSA